MKPLSKVIKMEISTESDRNRNVLARMMQISLIAYMSGGAFLSLAYFDLPWHIIAMAVILRQLAMAEHNTKGQPQGIETARTNSRLASRVS